jgi:hypothetical protein
MTELDNYLALACMHSMTIDSNFMVDPDFIISRPTK